MEPTHEFYETLVAHTRPEDGCIDLKIRVFEDLLAKNAKFIDMEDVNRLIQLVKDMVTTGGARLHRLSFRSSLLSARLFEQIIRSLATFSPSHFDNFSLDMARYAQNSRAETIVKVDALAALLQCKHIALRSLQLQGNGLRKEDFAKVFPALMKQKETLRELKVGNNEIGYFSMNNFIEQSEALQVLNTSFASTFSIAKFAGSIAGITHQRNLTVLDLRGVQMSLDELGDLSDSLQEKCAIQNLNLTSCKLGRADGSGMKVACKLLNIRTLKELCLGDNGIGKLGIIKLFEALVDNTTLLSLDLRNNNITVSAVENFIIPFLRKRKALIEKKMDEEGKNDGGYGLCPKLALDLRGNEKAYRLGFISQPQHCYDLFRITTVAKSGWAKFKESDPHFSMISSSEGDAVEKLGRHLITLAAGPEVYFGRKYDLYKEISNIRRLILYKQNFEDLDPHWVEAMHAHMPSLSELDISHNKFTTLPRELVALTCRTATNEASEQTSNAFVLKLSNNENRNGGFIDATDLFSVLFALNTTIVGLPDEQRVEALNMGSQILHVAIRLFHDYEITHMLSEIQREKREALGLGDPVDIEDLLFEQLLKMDALVNALDIDMRTPLHIACMYGRSRVIRKLIKCRKGANIDVMDKHGYLPCEMYRWRYLRHHGSDLMNSSVQWREEFGPDPQKLFRDCKTCAEEYSLLAKLNTPAGRHSLGMVTGPDVWNMLNAFLQESQSHALFHDPNNVSLEQQVLDTEEDEQYNEGEYRWDAWTVLLERMSLRTEPTQSSSSEIHVLAEKWMYLHYATMKGSLEQTKAMVDPNTLENHLFLQDRREWRTPFHFAAIGGHGEVVEFLLEKSKNIQLRDELQIQKSSKAKANMPTNQWKGLRDMKKGFVSSVPETSVSQSNILAGLTSEVRGGESFVDKWLNSRLSKSEAKKLKSYEDASDVGLFDIYEKTAMHYAVLNVCPEIVKVLCESTSTSPLDPVGSEDTAYNTAVVMSSTFIRLEKILQREGGDDDQPLWVKDTVEKSCEQLSILNKIGRVKSKRDRFLLERFAKSFLPYILFLFLLTISVPTSVGVGWVPENTYYLNQKTVAGLIEEEIAYATGDEWPTTFMDLNNLDDVHKWLSSPLAEFAFPTEDAYGDATTAGTEQLYAYSKNRILGVVRLRQVRVKGDTCWGQSPELEPSDYTCYPEFYLNTEDKSSFGTDGKYTWSENSGWSSTGVKWTSYPDNGYVIDITPGDSTAARAVITTLINEKWISATATRALFIEMAYYNEATDFIQAIELRMEMPATGGVIPSYQVVSFRPILSRSLETILTVCVEILVFFCVVSYFIFEVIELIQDVTSYFRSMWNYWDLLVFLLMIAKWIFQFTLMIEWFELDVDISRSQSTYYDLRTLSYLHFWSRTISATVLILCWLRLVKYLVTVPRIGPVIEAVRATVTDSKTLVFLALLCLCWFCFAMGAHFGLAPDLSGYRNYPQTMLSILRMLIGDFDADEVEGAAPVFGTLLWVSVTMFGNLLLLNLLIGVLSEVYVASWESIDAKWETTINTMMLYDMMDSRLTKLSEDFWSRIKAALCCKNGRSSSKVHDKGTVSAGGTTSSSDTTRIQSFKDSKHRMLVSKDSSRSIFDAPIPLMRRLSSSNPTPPMPDAKAKSQEKHNGKFEDESNGSRNGVGAQKETPSMMKRMKERYSSTLLRCVQEVRHFKNPPSHLEAGTVDTWDGALYARARYEMLFAMKEDADAAKKTLEEWMENVGMDDGKGESNVLGEKMTILSREKPLDLANNKKELARANNALGDGGHKGVSKTPGLLMEEVMQAADLSVAGPILTSLLRCLSPHNPDAVLKMLKDDIIPALQADSKSGGAGGEDNSRTVNRVDLDSDSAWFRDVLNRLEKTHEAASKAEHNELKDSESCHYLEVQVENMEHLFNLISSCQGFSKRVNQQVFNGKEHTVMPLTLAYDNGKEESIWGDGPKSKTVEKLYSEIENGETIIRICGKKEHENHQCKHDIVRVTQVAKMMVQMHDEMGNKMLLIETHQDRTASGRYIRRYTAPSEKILGTEDPWEGCERGCREEFPGFVDSDHEILFVPGSQEIKVESNLSPSYPGLMSQYNLYFFGIKIPTLPKKSFFTEESKDKGPSTIHRWEWFSESDYNTLLSVGDKKAAKVLGMALDESANGMFSKLSGNIVDDAITKTLAEASKKGPSKSQHANSKPSDKKQAKGHHKNEMKGNKSKAKASKADPPPALPPNMVAARTTNDPKEEDVNDMCEDSSVQRSDASPVEPEAEKGSPKQRGTAGVSRKASPEKRSSSRGLGRPEREERTLVDNPPRISKKGGKRPTTEYSTDEGTGPKEGRFYSRGKRRVSNKGVATYETSSDSRDDWATSSGSDNSSSTHSSQSSQAERRARGQRRR